jgi:hypothetical protein
MRADWHWLFLGGRTQRLDTRQLGGYVSLKR